MGRRKVVIIAALLVSEANAKTNEEIEVEITAELKAETIPWAERIEKVTVLSEQYP